MALGVNLDALVRREDFEVKTEGDEAPISQTIQVRDLEKSAFFYGALRKPDFQRETSEWDTKRVVGLIRTFVDGDLVPAVILWKNKDLIFVIDGSHRLSALIAWVQDDYGDGAASRAFFNHEVSDEQLRLAQRTREEVAKAVGSYAEHIEAVKSPDAFGPDIVARARRLGTLAMQLQWVRGDSAKAEASFIRINQQAAIITPGEMRLIQTRRRPTTIAARAVIRKGTGHKYWSSFRSKKQGEIERIASELHHLLFRPVLQYPLKSIDLPPGGVEYSPTALSMVYDFIELAVGVPDDNDDTDGTRTIECLKRAARLARLFVSNHASSLGLHPAVYFYSWTGKQQPILLLVMVKLIVDIERRRKLAWFAQLRGRFEGFLLTNRTLTNQIIRKFGTKDSGSRHLLAFYQTLLSKIESGTDDGQILAALKEDPNYSFLQPDETPYAGVRPTRFSKEVKSGVVIGKLLKTALKCVQCGGFVPAQAISVDHKVRRRDGGRGGADNAQVMHPYCNTGLKN